MPLDSNFENEGIVVRLNRSEFSRIIAQRDLGNISHKTKKVLSNQMVLPPLIAPPYKIKLYFSVRANSNASVCFSVKSLKHQFPYLPT